MFVLIKFIGHSFSHFFFFFTFVWLVEFEVWSITNNNKMTRGKQKIEAQKRNAEKNQKSKGSQIEARGAGLKITCPICKVFFFLLHLLHIMSWKQKKKIKFLLLGLYFFSILNLPLKTTWCYMMTCVVICCWVVLLHRFNRSGSCLFLFNFPFICVFKFHWMSYHTDMNTRHDINIY